MVDKRAEAPVWEEPVRGSFGDLSGLALSGVERMRRTVRGAGTPPPIHHLTGVKPVESGFGSSTFSMPVTPWLQTTVPGRGIPVISIAVRSGSGAAGGPGRAMGVVAVGNVAVGVVAVGLVAVGPVSLGLVSIGVASVGLVALGVVSTGIVSVGVVAAGVVVAGLHTVGVFPLPR